MVTVYIITYTSLDYRSNNKSKNTENIREVSVTICFIIAKMVIIISQLQLQVK